MLQLTPQSRVFLAREAADFRRGIDGLAALCRQRLSEDPKGGAIFVFRNRRGTSLKLLCYDGQGFWLCQKRLSQGRLNWWPSMPTASHRLSARELQILLWNGNPEEAGMADGHPSILGLHFLEGEMTSLGIPTYLVIRKMFQPTVPLAEKVPTESVEGAELAPGPTLDTANLEGATALGGPS